MSNAHYDAVFIGSSLISLLAALAAAKRGRSVFILAPPQVETSPHFADGPLLHFGYEPSGAMEGYFSTLSFSLPKLKNQGLRLHQNSPILQTVLPRHRLQTFAEDEATQAELKREFPLDQKKLQQLFKQISRETAAYYPYIGQFQQLETSGMAERLNEWKKQLDFVQAVQQQQKTAAEDLLHSHTFDKAVRHYFELLALFAKQKPLSSLSAFEFMEIISGLQRGAHSLQGGLRQRERFFLTLIEAEGGQVARNLRVMKSQSSSKALHSLQLSDGSTLSGSRFIVVPPATNRRLDLYFTIDTTVIPPPLRSPLLLSWGEDRPRHCEDLILLQKKQTDSGQNDQETTFAASLLFREDAAAKDEPDLRERLLNRLHWLMPFSESKIRFLEKKPVPEDKQSALSSIWTENKGSHRPKTLQKGLFSYLEPKDKKNIALLRADNNDFVSSGSDFLAGERLARWIETGK